MEGTEAMEAKIAYKKGMGKLKQKQYQEGFCISTRTGGCTTDREPESTQPAWLRFAKTKPVGMTGSVLCGEIFAFLFPPATCLERCIARKKKTKEP